MRCTLSLVAVAAVASAVAVDARPMHAEIEVDYHRYLQERASIIDELKAWMTKFRERAIKNDWLPVTPAHTTEEVEEDHRQRFFLTKQLVRRLEKENPNAVFSMDSPFTLMKPDEFSAYVRNSFLANGGRSLRDAGILIVGIPDIAREQSASAEVITAGSVRAGDFSSTWDDWFKRARANWQPTRTTEHNPERSRWSDWFNFDWSSLFRPKPSPLPSPSPSTSQPATYSPSTEPTAVPTSPPTESPTTAPTLVPTPSPTPSETTTPAPTAPSTPAATPSTTPEHNGNGRGVDWSAGKCMSPIQNQGHCGSCWSFATVAVIASAECIASGNETPVKYSEQTLVSCDERNKGCNGGIPSYAASFVQKNGLCTAESDPYTSSHGDAPACNTSCQRKTPSIQSVQRLQGEDALIAALDKHPVMVAVTAGNEVWKQYQSGVVSACPSGARIDHAVVAVGYDEATIKIRNSWGPRWGEQGYIRLARSAAGVGVCNVFQDVTEITIAQS
ncbi:hypothetical protein PINS_up001398 [Pythium insidiosum]|nr:hypothetical protein PINS_up001398 [Pythium insidiosum]